MTSIGELSGWRPFGWRPGGPCSHKERHLSPEDADAAMHAIKQRPDCQGAETLNVYLCKFCKGYHVGRKAKRQREQP